MNSIVHPVFNTDSKLLCKIYMFGRPTEKSTVTDISGMLHHKALNSFSSF
jgi:hypothetical protein